MEEKCSPIKNAVLTVKCRLNGNSMSNVRRWKKHGRMATSGWCLREEEGNTGHAGEGKSHAAKNQKGIKPGTVRQRNRSHRESVDRSGINKPNRERERREATKQINQQ